MSIPPETRKARIERITLPIFGPDCQGSGSLIIEGVLLRVPGVVYAYVNPATEMAYVQYDPALCNPDELSAAIQRAGFEAGKPSLR